MNLEIQRNKAIVGDNAFAHEAGIHQDGMLKERTTYEIIDPREVGVPSSRLVIGKHSGRHALRRKLQELGYHVDDQEVDQLMQRVKDLADRKKAVYDADIEALVTEHFDRVEQTYELQAFHVTAGRGLVPTATMRLSKKGEELVDAATGDGPVAAAYGAIDRITGLTGDLQSYHIDAVTGGREALGQVSVTVQFDGREVQGRGVSTDIIEASVLAYLAAVNRYLARKSRTRRTKKRKQP
jgi:2-isopropylmalate synthase